MKCLYPIFFLCFLTQNNGLRLDGSRNSIANRTSHLLSSAETIVKGLSKEIINVIPTPEELFNAAPEVLIGLPEQAVLGTINKLCSLYMASDTIDPKITPDVSTMALILHTPCNQQSYPLLNAENILENPDFDVNKKLAVFVTGWRVFPDRDYVTAMGNAFNCRGDYNFVVLNSSDAIDTLYTWSAYNTQEVGHQLALSLEKLINQVPVENIHLIGHSLGAHIVGYAGRYFTKNTGLNLTRITGLDPANPCFNEGETLSGLQRGDAEFIDIIHTNPGVFGKRDPVGDADFYAGGLAPIKPGCIKLVCSHTRAIEFFTESILPENELDFLGVRCTSLTNLNNGFCDGPKYPMGLATPYNLKGNYFLAVNSKSPYGKNANKHGSASTDCQLCKT